MGKGRVIFSLLNMSCMPKIPLAKSRDRRYSSHEEGRYRNICRYVKESGKTFKCLLNVSLDHYDSGYSTDQLITIAATAIHAGVPTRSAGECHLQQRQMKAIT